MSGKGRGITQYFIKDRLKGKTAIVTASTEGIGYAIVERLGLEGANVVVSSRKAANVSAALKKLTDQKINAIGVVCHVSNAPDRKKLFDETIAKFGGIDIIVSNAAVNPEAGDTLNCSEQAYDKSFEVNVKASFMLAKEARPFIRKRGGGSIVFISSIAGFQPHSPLGLYSITKTAILGLTKAVAIDLAPENIRVNCICPGLIKTRFSSALTKTPKDEELQTARVPINRLGKIEEMAGVASFLVSEDASYITGENIVAAGGVPSRL